MPTIIPLHSYEKEEKSHGLIFINAAHIVEFYDDVYKADIPATRVLTDDGAAWYVKESADVIYRMIKGE